MRCIICVTGKIAAGKNAVAALLEQRGYRCVDADTLGHRALIENESRIISEFADDARKKNIAFADESGHINRKALGALLFSDAALLKRHEAIVYPSIERQIEAFILAHPDEPIAINAAGLYKLPAILRRCACIIYVDASPLRRLLRIRRRDALPLPQILRRFLAQRKLLLQYAHTAIPPARLKTNTTRQTLARRLTEILRFYRLSGAEE